jgi:hypothetical protein
VRPPVGTTNSARPVTLMGVSRRAGLYSGSAAAQAVDEIGEADLTSAAEALGGDDRLNLRNARIELAVDDDVIVFRPVAHFFGRFRHARGDGGGAVLGARAGALRAQPCRAAAFDPKLTAGIPIGRCLFMPPQPTSTPAPRFGRVGRDRSFDGLFGAAEETPAGSSG